MELYVSGFKKMKIGEKFIKFVKSCYTDIYSCVTITGLRPICLNWGGEYGTDALLRAFYLFYAKK